MANQLKTKQKEKKRWRIVLLHGNGPYCGFVGKLANLNIAECSLASFEFSSLLEVLVCKVSLLYSNNSDLLDILH